MPTTTPEVAADLAVGRPQGRADLRNEKINYKVREHSLAKVPVIAVVGRREAEERPWRCAGWAAKQQEVLALRDATTRLQEEAKAA